VILMTLLGIVVMGIMGFICAQVARKNHKKWRKYGSIEGGELYAKQHNIWLASWWFFTFFMACVWSTWITLGGISDLLILPLGCALPAAIITRACVGHWKD
jgi:isoprenylcysteine carboxyl methyltransferase (ICMT) family protein YpbQ